MTGNTMDRRSFLTISVNGLACCGLPSFMGIPLDFGRHLLDPETEGITQKVRERTLFAGIRRPIHSREDLTPRIESLRETLGDRITGPLTHIFRFDTPVEGYDSEIGFPVSEVVNAGEIRTHHLRSMHFFSNVHEGSMETVPQTRSLLYQYMNQVGLSPELELVEVFHRYDRENPENQRIESMASYLPWPEKYREELVRVLGEEKTEVVWEGGETITPHTLVDDRAHWVGESIQRLQVHATEEEQFDILSRVALVFPPENTARLREAYETAGGDIQAVFDAQHAEFLAGGRTVGRFDSPWFDGKTLHLSKVPYNEAAYLEARTPEEFRKAHCFCALVREAEDPQIDPVFCYRAAGWARQYLEAIMDVEFKRCEITHSILKGDRLCAWDFNVE